MKPKRWYIVTVDDHPLDQVATWPEAEAQVGVVNQIVEYKNWDYPRIDVQVWDIHDNRAVLHHTRKWGTWKPGDLLPDTPEQVTPSVVAEK